MKYQLKSSEWRANGKLFDDAPIRLHGLQFMLDTVGNAITIRTSQTKAFARR